jgi:hypothetical protein
MEYLLVALILTFTHSGAFYAGVKHEEANTVRLELIAVKAAEKSQEAAAIEIAKIEIKNTTIEAKVIERVKTEKVYQDCNHTPETYQLILDAYKK